jgi:hypothetical protein
MAKFSKGNRVRLTAMPTLEVVEYVTETECKVQPLDKEDIIRSAVIHEDRLELIEDEDPTPDRFRYLDKKEGGSSYSNF